MDEAVEKGKLYLQDIDKDSSARIKDSLTLIAINAKETNKTGENGELQKILSKMDLGVLAESQRKNAISIATAQMSLNQAYQESADLINEVEADKAQIEKDKIDAALRRAQALPIYDPMKNEKEIRSKGYGFP